jgi:hypothetical protein
MTRAHRLPLVARLPTASMKAPKTAHPKVRSTEYLKASMTASGWVHSTDCSKALKTAQPTASTTVPKMGHPKVHSTDCWKASTKAPKNARKNRLVQEGTAHRKQQSTIQPIIYLIVGEFARHQHCRSATNGERRCKSNATKKNKMMRRQRQIKNKNSSMKAFVAPTKRKQQATISNATYLP